MNFRSWSESDAGLGVMPFSANRGSGTPASDEVKRTGLQPQVDSHEIQTSQKDETDKVLAIDAKIKGFENEIPEGDATNNPKVNKFKKLWEKLKEKWEQVKSEEDEDSPHNPEDGLGSNPGDENLIRKMQQNPNMAMTGPDQVPTRSAAF